MEAQGYRGRGTEPCSAVDASVGTFEVYYPAAMQEADGAVQAQMMISRGGDTYISSRVFTIRVEPVVVGGEEHEDGFTMFVDAINAYEHTIEVTTDAATDANTAARAANAAAIFANGIATSIQEAATRGDYDGADGQDGVSPTVTIEQMADGVAITVTDASGTTTASVANGAKGEKGERGETGLQGPAGANGMTFTPVSPLSLDNGELSVDLSGYADGNSLMAQNPLSIANDVISIDLTAYATKQYVDDAIAAIVSLEEEEI